MRLLALVAAVAVLAAPAPKTVTFATLGRQAEAALLGTWYAGGGMWRQCNAQGCATGNSDWGLDSLTYTLARRYESTRDNQLLPPRRALVQTAPSYPAA